MFCVRKAAFPASLVVIAGVLSAAQGQLIPGGAPAAPAVPGVAAPVSPLAAPAAEPRLGFFGRLAQRIRAFRTRITPTPLGQLLNNATKPLSALTGGVIPGGAPKPTDKEVAAPGVGGAAAEGKKDAAEAKKRADDVKFLGTLDCRYYPNASKGLADALRTDPSECVRYEAALALSRACCCNKTTVAALEASVSGTDADGNPGERSARVRCTAAAALERCLACYTPPEPEKDPEQEKKTGEPDKADDKGGGEPGKNGTAKALSPMPSKAAVERARQTLEQFRELVAVSAPVIQPEVQPMPKSVFHLVMASADEPQPVRQAVYAPAAAMTAQKPIPAPALAAKPAPTKPTPAKPASVPAQMPAEAVTAKPPAADDKPAATLKPATVADAPVVPAAGLFNAPAAPVSRDAEAVKALSTQALQGGNVAGQHEAIRELVKHEWKKHPLVAATLLLGAKTDKFTNVVRVDCLRHLAVYQMSHREVLDGLAGLSADADPWVRQEAGKALEALTAGK